MTHTYLHRGAFWWLSCKEFAYDAGYLGLIPGWEEKDYRRGIWQPTPVFLPEQSRDRGTWQATVCAVTRVKHGLVTNHQCA